jgi:hypothetical protein
MDPGSKILQKTSKLGEKAVKTADDAKVKIDKKTK